MKKILFILGANLKYLGQREKDIYGSKTIDEIYESMNQISDQVQIEMLATNSEGEIIDALMEKDYDALIINPGAYTHYSLVIYDALRAKEDKFKVEVHMTNVYKREDFRQQMTTSGGADAIIMGMGEKSYYLAVKAICDYFSL